MSDQPLAELLGEALPGGPAALRPAQSCADALAVVLHCLMVRDGWAPLDRAGRPLRGCRLPEDWNKVDNLWAFDYTRPGAAHPFRLQLGLQPQTRRMFIHASELDAKGDPVPDNIQVMGLQCDNYIKLEKQDEGAGSSWHGVVASEATLAEMWEEFVAAPLWGRAEKAATPLAGSSGWAAVCYEQCSELSQAVSQQQHVLLPVAAGLAAVGVAALLLYRRR